MESQQATTMSTLADFIKTKEMRRRFVLEAVTLVDKEAHARGGLTGIAIKGAYHVVKKIKPTIIEETIEHLLDGFVAGLEPFYQRHLHANQGSLFSDLLIREKSQVAHALLQHTDDKAKESHNAILKKTYEKLRPIAHEQVMMSVPAVARMIDQHMAFVKQV